MIASHKITNVLLFTTARKFYNNISNEKRDSIKCAIQVAKLKFENICFNFKTISYGFQQQFISSIFRVIVFEQMKCYIWDGTRISGI